jgi:hypothetical protein
MKKLRKLSEDQEREVFNERLNGSMGKDIVSKWVKLERSFGY